MSPRRTNPFRPGRRRAVWAAVLLFAAVRVDGDERAAVVRAQVAGQFYPAEASELRRQVGAFLAAAPPGRLDGPVAAVLAPHAGYVFSGAVAGRAHAVLRGGHWRRVVVLASGHTRAVRGAATVADGSFETPLGSVSVDAEAVRRLRRACDLVGLDPGAFDREHSVEVQLPFLQTVLGPFRLVPLLMNTDDPETCRRVGEAVAGLLKDGDTLLVVSSDLSHYPDRDTARAADMTTLLALARAPEDPDYFRKTCRLALARGGSALQCVYCGEAAVLAAQHAMRAVGARGKLLAYANSGDVPGGDPARAVGYAAFVWTRGGAPAPRPPLDDGQRRALLALARAALERHVAGRKPVEERIRPDPEFNLPGAVYVTLWRNGVPRAAALRGCMGNVEPERPLAEAAQAFAVESAVRDPRFPPVRAEELPGLTLEISRLTPWRPVGSAADIKPGQGVLLQQGDRAGLFLPQVWESLPDRTSFLEELCDQKAGLPRDCWKDARTRFLTFDAEVFEETPTVPREGGRP